MKALVLPGSLRSSILLFDLRFELNLIGTKDEKIDEEMNI